MRRMGFIFLIISFLILFIAPSSAVIDTEQKIYDNAELFSDDEENNLKQRAQELVKICNMDVLIVTIKDTEGKTSKNFTDAFYDDNGFGLGEDRSGLALFIDMNNLESYISTRGSATRIFTYDRLDKIIDSITHSLSIGKYAKASSLFLEDVDYYFKSGIPDVQQNMTGSKDSSYFYSAQGNFQIAVAKSLKYLKIFISIALGGSLIIVGCMILNNRGRKTTNASTYLQPGSFILNNEQDIYSGSTVTQREINTDSGSRKP